MARKLVVPPPAVARRTLGETLLIESADEADPAEVARTVVDSVINRTIRARRCVTGGSFQVEGGLRPPIRAEKGASYRAPERPSN